MMAIGKSSTKKAQDSFEHLLKTARKNLQISGLDISKSLGITKQRYYQIECGYRSNSKTFSYGVSKDTLKKLSKTLKIPYRELVDKMIERISHSRQSYYLSKD